MGSSTEPRVTALGRDPRTAGRRRRLRDLSRRRRRSAVAARPPSATIQQHAAVRRTPSTSINQPSTTLAVGARSTATIQRGSRGGTRTCVAHGQQPRSTNRRRRSRSGSAKGSDGHDPTRLTRRHADVRRTASNLDHPTVVDARGRDMPREATATIQRGSRGGTRTCAAHGQQPEPVNEFETPERIRARECGSRPIMTSCAV